MLIDPRQIKMICDVIGINMRGVLHVGAHKCEEKNSYNTIWNISDDNIIWIDANKNLVDENIRRGISNCYVAALDETERVTTFNITNNGESSSILELGTHKESYPDIVVVEKQVVRTQTLLQFFERTMMDIRKYNIWNFDIQGSELHVLRGSKELLQFADVIYTEVNTDTVYQNCGLLSELDCLLYEAGLERVAIQMTHANWGDALYVRKYKIDIPNVHNLHIFNNCNSKTNGEEQFFLSIKDKINTIFDVGCRSDSEFNIFKGDVHYFDPVTQFIEELMKQSNSNHKSYYNNFGLGDENKNLYYYPKYQSFYDRINSCKISDDSNKVLLNIKKGKDYIKENNITEIDFLKIDTEGYELNVLKGFEDCLECVKIIQFEYGGTFLDNNIKLIDVINYLEEKNFYKFSYITNNGPIIISDFKDHYQYCNIVCINKNSTFIPF